MYINNDRIVKNIINMCDFHMFLIYFVKVKKTVSKSQRLFSIQLL